MNERVQLLIDKRKKELDEERKNRREKYLIELGLYKEEKETIWSEKVEMTPEWKYDSEKAGYYKEVVRKKAIDISDEEYDTLCKFYPETVYGNNEVDSDHTEDIAPVNCKTERALIVLSKVILIGGMLTAVVLIAFYYVSLSDVISLLFIIFVSWALLRCLADMSITLKEIKKKLQNRQ